MPQWQKGQSGNPNGRPAGTKNVDVKIRELYAQLFDEPIIKTDKNGVRHRNGVPLWAELHFLHIPSEFTTSQPKHFPLHRTQKQAVDLLCEIGNHNIFH